jgi:ABC-type microcin C transport system permease subunit YejB
LRLLRRFRPYREYELQRWDLKVVGTEMARLRYEAGLAGPDVPLLQALFLLFSAAVIVANLIADLLYARLDPRVRT